MTMKTIRPILFLLSFVLIFISCALPTDCVKGHGQTMVQNRYIKGFKAISAEGISNVVIKKDSVFSVKVYDYKDMIPHLQTVLDGDVLRISYDYNCVNDTVSRVEITLPELREIRILGSGDVNVSGDFSENQNFVANISGSGDLWLNGDFGKNLNIKILGSGDANLNLKNEVNQIKISSSGSGDIQITGTYARNLIVSDLGSGDIDVSGIMARTVRVKSVGSGDSRVYVVDSLFAKLSGSGDLCYKGNPEYTQIQGLGSGEIKHCH